MITKDLKLCPRCKKELPVNQFHKAGNYLQGKCKSCVVAYVAEWKREHPEMTIKSRAEYKRNWRKRVPAERKAYLNRKWALKRDYGMTPEEYDAILAAQGGVCAICGGTQKLALSVDHNHETGENRGLLCGLCNCALERIESIPDWNEKVLNYLAKYLTVRMDVKMDKKSYVQGGY